MITARFFLVPPDLRRTALLCGGFGLLLCFFSALSAYAEVSTTTPATITSDELEMHDNGAQTIFIGHVVLTEKPYLLYSDKMIRTKETGVVDAHGHLDGTWLSDKGEKIKAYGDNGRYSPTPPVTELWDHAKMIRWETARDTEPVQIVADRLTAFHDAKEFYAKGHVVITKDPKILTRSDEANYDQKIQTIHLYGPERIFVHVADAKGSGDFTSEEGWMTLDPKTARLVGHVQGHVIPSASSSL